MINKIYEIKLKIHEESDLYSTFDPEKEILSDEVSSYLKKKFSENTFPFEKIELKIISEMPLNQERCKKNIRAYVENELNLLSRQKKRSIVKQIWLFALGIIFIALWLFLERITESVLATVVCIVGWFAVWEAANIWLVESPEMRIEKLRLQKMQKTEIKFEILENHSQNVSENLTENVL